ncbi:putative ribonuclease H-like domain-containing protein [Tanacetum coccineum]
MMLKMPRLCDAKKHGKRYEASKKDAKNLLKHICALMVSNEGANLKFLRSLPSVWHVVTTMIRGQPGLDALDFDDLYNNLKVYEHELKGASSSSSQNIAFMSTEIKGSTSKQSTADDFPEIITKEFGDEPVTFAMVALNGLGEDDRSMEIDAEHVDFGQDGLGDFDWSEEADNAPVALALMATSSTDSSNSEMRDWKLGEKQKELDKVIKERDELKDKLEKWSNATLLQIEILNSQKVLSDKTCIVFGVEYSSSEESDNSSRDEKLTSPLYENFKREKAYKAVPPPIGTIMPPRANVSFTGIDELTIRNKVINKQKSESSGSDSKTCEFKRKTVLKSKNSEKSSENRSPRTQDSFGQGSRRRGLGYREQKLCYVPLSKKVFYPISSTYKGRVEKPNFPRPVINTYTGRPYYPRMDNVRPKASSFSPSKRSYNTRTVHRPKSPKPIVKSNWVKKESTARTQAVLPQNKEELKDHAIIDSGCSGSMTGDKDKLSDFKEYKGGYVAFGNDPKGGRITGKGTIKTSCIDFENVSYVKELKFNLLSVSQICDKKHNVLFTDTECLILSPEFKVVDENVVILRAPRKNDVYSLNLNSSIPSGGVTCLVAKETKDEAILWHRRLGHVNFKNINKLVKGNLVRGLPSKTFKHDHSCLACRKGKQHKASCKKLEERTVREPLELLHMDLFGPVSVASLNRKKYCLVVTDDCSRFSWVFFLVYKDETYDILHDLIVGLENKLRRKVKTIRCDHGTEFKNKLMNEFCAKKGIQREYSIARTPQQNGVAERKNRTLIEAARTMLADSLLPIQFWAEAVHTACYVLNRVLVTKPQMKTPYELLMEKSPNISFMKPFGCPLTILNTMDHLSKFEGKSEEGYLLGYSTNSKGFRVYNRVTRKVQDCLHVDFLEDQRNQKGKGPDWIEKAYKAVPPPTGTIIPPRADVAFTGIDELAIRNKVINKENSESSGTDHESCESKNRDDLIKNKEQTQNTVKSNTDRNKVIIEDWVDSDDEEVPLGFSEIKKQQIMNLVNLKTEMT